jgi:hypothetical protein
MKINTELCCKRYDFLTNRTDLHKMKIIWKILHFYSSFSLNPSKFAFFHMLTLSLLPKNHMLFIASKQCACSRRVRIEGHIDRVGGRTMFGMLKGVMIINLFIETTSITEHHKYFKVILSTTIVIFSYPKLLS